MSNSGYYSWLMDVIDGPRQYSRVLKHLRDIEYTWVNPMDENRAADGLELRYYYEDETGFKCNLRTPCSVLEMLIALARRMEDDFMYDFELGYDRTDVWFWEIFSNLGLDKYDDSSYFEEEIDEIVYGFMEKEPGHNLFLVKDPPENWADLEVWWQLNRYVSEKFGVFS